MKYHTADISNLQRIKPLTLILDVNYKKKTLSLEMIMSYQLMWYAFV